MRARPLRRLPTESTYNFSAIANCRNSKPNDARSTANGLATNTSGEVQAAGPWIEAWLAAEPSRPEPWVMRGLSRIGWAWEARGSGRAEDVPEDAWPEFSARLKLGVGRIYW